MKILLYCKNTEGNVKALQIAVEQAKAFNGSIHMVSCIAEQPGVPEEITEQAIKKAEKKMQGYVEEYFVPAGINCTPEVIVTTTFAGEHVVSYAEEIEADTIIMSIQRRSKIGKMVFGSNSQFIILEASCKVITVK